MRTTLRPSKSSEPLFSSTVTTPSVLCHHPSLAPPPQHSHPILPSSTAHLLSLVHYHTPRGRALLSRPRPGEIAAHPSSLHRNVTPGLNPPALFPYTLDFPTYETQSLMIYSHLLYFSAVSPLPNSSSRMYNCIMFVKAEPSRCSLNT